MVAGYVFFNKASERGNAKTKEACAALHTTAADVIGATSDVVAARQKVEAHVITLFAGPLAQGWVSAGRDRLARSSDYAKALDVAMAVSSGDRREAAAYLDWLLIRAKRMTSRPGFRQATEAIAGALIERSPLAFADAKEIIDDVSARVDLERMEDHPLLRGE